MSAAKKNSLTKIKKPMANLEVLVYREPDAKARGCAEAAANRWAATCSSVFALEVWPDTDFERIDWPPVGCLAIYSADGLAPMRCVELLSVLTRAGVKRVAFAGKDEGADCEGSGATVKGALGLVHFDRVRAERVH